MGENENKTNEELLYELGYDERDHLHSYEEGEKMNEFMKQTNREILKEAQRHIDEIEDYEDDSLISLKRSTLLYNSIET